MTKTFPIDFVRQVIEQTLLEEHNKQPSKYFGGRNQVNLFSFYEQLQKDDEVNRYVECYRDLVDQQNRTGLIMNGTIIAPENPTITNLYQCLIIPMSFTCSFRVKLGDRDSAINTINHLIETLKGRKCDIAEFENGELFKVGTIANENDGEPYVENGDYIGQWSWSTRPLPLNTRIENILSTLSGQGIEYGTSGYPKYLYYGYRNTNSGNYGMYLAKKEPKDFDIEINTDTGCYDIEIEQEDDNEYIVSGKIDFNSINDNYEQILPISGLQAKLSVSCSGYSKDYDNVDIEISENNCQLEDGVISGYGTFSITIPLSTWGGDYVPDDVSFQEISNQPIMLGWEQIDSDDNMLIPPQGLFTKYKLSLSFDSLRCDEPRNLNADEYCTISFGGSATLVSNGVALGNDLVKLGIKKLKIMSNPIIEISDTYKWLEPLELPSGNNVDTQVNQLLSNNFITNTHSDNISLSMQYTFVCDRDIDIINQFFKYGRYGIQGTATNNYLDGITPNMIYKTQEIWSSWGNVETITFKTKIVESVDIENTESDTLSITIPFQIQGENN